MIKFNNNYNFDNKLLSVTPLMLLYYFNSINFIQKALIVCICICNFIYWNSKNIITFILDVFFTNLFIIYNLFLFYKKERFLTFIFLIPIVIFFIYSFLNGQNGSRQIIQHLIFRFFVLLLFLKNIYVNYSIYDKYNINRWFG